MPTASSVVLGEKQGAPSATSTRHPGCAAAAAAAAPQSKSKQSRSKQPQPVPGKLQNTMPSKKESMALARREAIAVLKRRSIAVNARISSASDDVSSAEAAIRSAERALKDARKNAQLARANFASCKEEARMASKDLKEAEGRWGAGDLDAKIKDYESGSRQEEGGSTKRRKTSTETSTEAARGNSSVSDKEKEKSNMNGNEQQEEGGSRKRRKTSTEAIRENNDVSDEGGEESNTNGNNTQGKRFNDEEWSDWVGWGKYTGKLDARGRRCGWGSITYDSGQVYTGNWKNDRYDGWGFWWGGDEDGAFNFKGEWKNGKRHGQGTMYFSNDDVAVCKYENNHRSGRCVRWSKDRKKAWLIDEWDKTKVKVRISLSRAEEVASELGFDKAPYQFFSTGAEGSGRNGMW